LLLLLPSLFLLLRDFFSLTACLSLDLLFLSEDPPSFWAERLWRGISSGMGSNSDIIFEWVFWFGLELPPKGNKSALVYTRPPLSTRFGLFK
jgi:hypothetical protein